MGEPDIRMKSAGAFEGRHMGLEDVIDCTEIPVAAAVGGGSFPAEYCVPGIPGMDADFFRRRQTLPFRDSGRWRVGDSVGQLIR
jgi:hypothetical protein